MSEDISFEWGKKPFAKGQERKRLLDEANSEMKESIPKEAASKAYNHADSLLSRREDAERRGYVFYLGHGASFEDTFASVLPEGRTDLKEYIETTLADKKGTAVGIEFGGLGSALFAGFSHGFFKKSVGISLVDNRDTWGKVGNPFQEPISKEDDDERHHTVMAGNILNDELYTRLNEWLAGDKADLIIERMIIGIHSLPEDPYLIGKIVSKWYELLNQNGILLVQVPVVLHDVLPVWAEHTRKEYSDFLEIQVELGHEEFNDSLDLLRLRKLPGAPGKLPLLKPREINRIGAATLDVIDDSDW